MAQRRNRLAKGHYPLPLVGLCGALALAVPSAGLALAGDALPGRAASLQALGIGIFTPASVDPDLAARFADKARARGIHFTPAGAQPITGKRTVTVAIRVDQDAPQIVSVRKAPEAFLAGRGVGLASLDVSKFQLGSARGYQSFTRSVDLSGRVNSMSLPDLAQFEPSKPKAEKPSRLQPRIELEDREIAGRSPNTLDSIGSQTVGVGGSFRLSPTLNVTAGVRYSQERDRLNPLTNATQDSQAVYVGTQIKF